MIEKIVNYIQHPIIFKRVILNHLGPFIKNDKIFIKLKWKLSDLSYPLDLDNPKTFNEKIQWLKLYDRKPEYTQMVDKAESKKWVASRIGEEYIIPTIGVWNSVDDINWDNLPSQFVMKCTHDSGGLVICKDKARLNKEKARKKLNHYLHRYYYWQNREWPYKDVKPRIICEQYMEDESGYELKDYKIFCFNGKPKFLFVATGRQQHDTRFDFFDINFNHLPVLNGHPNADKPISKPQNFDKMLEIASKLSSGMVQVRVDLYNINGKIYFGEMTFSHWSGFVPFEPIDWDYKFGDLITLPNKKMYNE